MFLKLCATAIALAPVTQALADSVGSRSGDDKMTCAMITREMQPSMMALSASTGPQAVRAKQNIDERIKTGKKDPEATKAIQRDVDSILANAQRSLENMDQSRMQHLLALAEAKNCYKR